MRRRDRRALRPGLERLDDRCLLSGLTPQQVAHSYGLDAVTFGVNGKAVRGDGTGQTIAIIEAFHDPSLANDLRTFDRAYGLPDPGLTVINQAGARSDDGWAAEEAMDVEWAHALAPGARILVVEARSDGMNDLIAAVDAARNTPGVSVVSMSWGGSEFPGQTSYDPHFNTPNGHNGVIYVAASGDAGGAGGAEWPASSTRVVGVGGTSLRVGAGGGYLSESLWAGSSGGGSLIEWEPGFQRSVQSTGRRTTPDVSFVGDPNTGVSAYATTPSTGKGSWQLVGGTSLGAPAWAAIFAVVDQGRNAAGKPDLDGPSQALPALYALPAGAFHKVASGWSFRSFGGATAGLGTPNGSALINALAGVPSGSVSSTATRTTKTTTPVTTTTTRTTTSTFSSRLTQPARSFQVSASTPCAPSGVWAAPSLPFVSGADRPRFVFDILPPGRTGAFGFGGLFRSFPG